MTDRTKIERVGRHLLIGDEAIPIAQLRASSCTKADVRCYVWSEYDEMDDAPIVAHGWTAREILEVAYGGGEWLYHPKPSDEAKATIDEIESQRETIRSLHATIDDLTSAGLKLDAEKVAAEEALRAMAAEYNQMSYHARSYNDKISRELRASELELCEAKEEIAVLREALRRVLKHYIYEARKGDGIMEDARDDVAAATVLAKAKGPQFEESAIARGLASIRKAAKAE